MNPADGETPVFTAAEALRERWRKARAPRIPPPQTAILCYQPDLLEYARRSFAVRRVDGFFGEVYALKAGGGNVAIAGNFGLGAPAAVIQVEELAAFGVRRFLSLGAAGSLQPGAAPGDWLVCTRALCDDSTSGHYVGRASRPTMDGPEARPTVEADPGMTAFLQAALAAERQPLQSGAVWTTGAPYRETRAEVAAYQSQGVCAVDMEIAALFAAGSALGLQVGAALVLADRVSPEGWRLPPDGDLIRKSLRRLLEAVVAGLFREGEEK